MSPTFVDETAYARQALGDVFADAWWLWECKGRMMSARTAIVTAAVSADPIIRDEAMNCWMSYERVCFVKQKHADPAMGFGLILKELAWSSPDRGQA